MRRPQPVHWAPVVTTLRPLCGIRLRRALTITSDPRAVTCLACARGVVTLGRSLALAFPYGPAARLAQVLYGEDP